ncbi:MAG: hypothetical protein AB8F95_20165 [Bacteroidia bacterium]
MKKLFCVLGLLIVLMAFGCGDSDAKKKEMEAAKATILEIEALDASIDSVSNEIKAKEASLEAALEDL